MSLNITFGVFDCRGLRQHQFPDQEVLCVPDGRFVWWESKLFVVREIVVREMNPIVGGVRAIAGSRWFPGLSDQDFEGLWRRSQSRAMASGDTTFGRLPAGLFRPLFAGDSVYGFDAMRAESWPRQDYAEAWNLRCGTLVNLVEHWMAPDDFLLERLPQGISPPRYGRVWVGPGVKWDVSWEAGRLGCVTERPLVAGEVADWFPVLGAVADRDSVIGYFKDEEEASFVAQESARFVSADRACPRG